jgi:hypothetical protein
LTTRKTRNPNKIKIHASGKLNRSLPKSSRNSLKASATINNPIKRIEKSPLNMATIKPNILDISPSIFDKSSFIKEYEEKFLLYGKL